MAVEVDRTPDGPLVSVVVPTYQSERTLGAALSSALTQTYPHVEVVVVIDGATDRSQQIAEGYGDLVRVVVQENAGVSAARNTAIEHARGEYIALLDADDIMLPSFVESCLDHLRECGDDHSFVATNSIRMGRKGLVDHAVPHPRHDLTNQRMRTLEQNIATGHALFPRRMWQDAGGFPVGMTASEDWDFWTRAIFAGWTLHLLPEPLALYRMTPGSASSDGEAMTAGHRLARQRMVELLGDRMTPQERAFAEQTLRLPDPHENLARAADSLAAGDVEDAARRCREASAVWPSDRRLRLKAELLTRLPVTARLYRRREQQRLQRLER